MKETIIKDNMKFDIERKDLYCIEKQSNETMKKRLTVMAELGMEEVGVAQFGIREVMSGLYIEMVWNFTDEKFNDYMTWVKNLKMSKSLLPMVQFILEIDWLSTVEFCDTFNLPHPRFTGEVESSAKQFVNLDLVKHRMFVEYAKLLNKKLTADMFVGKNPLILGFKNMDTRGGNPKFKCGKYEITNDQYGFWLEPYDSVDGRRLSKVEDLVNYGFYYNK